MYTYIGVVLVDTDGSVLAQHRDNNPSIPEPDKWGICGGKREEDDISDEVAGAREIFEETGYVMDPRELKELGGDEFTVGTTHIQRRFFWGRYDGKQPILTNEGQEIRFLQKDELPLLEFCDPYHVDYLQEASTRSLSASGIEGSHGRRK